MEHILFDGNKVFCGNLCEELRLCKDLQGVQDTKKIEIKNSDDSILEQIKSLTSNNAVFCFDDIKCINIAEYLAKSGKNVVVHTNCFDEKLLTRVNSGAIVVFDMDCDSANVALKFGKNFDKLTEEVNKFDCTKITFGYTLSAGINDTVEAMDEWLDFVKNVGGKNIYLDVENKYVIKNTPSEISAHILILADYVEKRAKDEDMTLTRDEFLNKVLECRKYPKSSYVMQFKELLKSVVAELTEKNLHKN